MDRLIEVKINGSYVTKDNQYAGVQGEGNVTQLRIEFDAGWDGYAKTIVFRNALGTPTTPIVLTTSTLEDITVSTRVYRVFIPYGALDEAGDCTFIIDGYRDGTRQRSVYDTLTVKDAPYTPIPSPTDPTPTQAEQLQSEIDEILGILRTGIEAGDKAVEAEHKFANMTVGADSLNPGQPASVVKTDVGSTYHLQFNIPMGYSIASVEYEGGGIGAGDTSIYAIRINDAQRSVIGRISVYNGQDGESSNIDCGEF